MILLYKDPKGKTIGSTTKAASVVGNAVSQMDTTYHSDWEKKIASLERALRERDAKIALLMKSQNCSEKVGDYACDSSVSNYKAAPACKFVGT